MKRMRTLIIGWNKKYFKYIPIINMNKQELICDCDVIHKEVVEKVKEVMPEKQAITNLTSLYKAFADKTRLEILYALHRVKCVFVIWLCC